MFHDIVKSDDLTSGFQNESAFQYKVEVGRFEELVRALAERNDVIFSFDDGGISFLTDAAPILEKYGKKGLFFISTMFIGTKGFLTKEQVRELESRGHIVGSHSHSHPHNMAALTDAEIDEEWRESCAVLQDILGHEVKCASIPNGYGSKSIYRSVRKAGFTELYTSVPTTKTTQKGGLTTIGRYVVHRDMKTEDVVLLATDVARQRKMYRRWQVLEQAKKVLGGNYDRVKALFVK